MGIDEKKHRVEKKVGIQGSGKNSTVWPAQLLKEVRLLKRGNWDLSILKLHTERVKGSSKGQGLGGALRHSRYLNTHTWRGSALTAKRAREEDGTRSKVWKGESRVGRWMPCASSSGATSRSIFCWQIAIEVQERKQNGRRVGEKNLKGGDWRKRHESHRRWGRG